MSITELAKEERVGFKSPAVMGGVGTEASHSKSLEELIQSSCLQYRLTHQLSESSPGY
jgi:hypothetical protein